MSPVVLAPVSTAYCSLSLAPPPVSVMYQPLGSAVFVVDPAVLESVSKVSVTGVPIVVRLMLPVPVSALTRRLDKERQANRMAEVIRPRTAPRKARRWDTLLIEDFLDT